MKQAILITAYKDFDQLTQLIDEFDENFSIYIHIDRKSKISEKKYQDLKRRKIVRYVGQDYKVNWGGLNHLKSYLKLSQIAFEDKENIYFHLITGQDFPIKNNEYFMTLIDSEEKRKCDYLSYFKLPNTYWENGGMDRLEHYNLYDLFDAKKSKRWIKLIKILQTLLHFKRPINDYLGQLYGGSTYWSLSRDTLQYVLDFTANNRRFLKRFNYTFCAEEIYFQTVIMNSSCSKRVVNNSLRFADWKSGKGGYPAFLDEGDFHAIINSDNIFARKIDCKESKLLQMLTIKRRVRR